MKNLKVIIIGIGGIGTALCDKLSRFLNYSYRDYNVEMILVDGDSFEQKNHERQSFNSFGQKSVEKSMELESRFGNVIFTPIVEYVKENNVSEIICENSIVFSGVDNHATRKIISDHCSKLNDVVFISGGNSLVDGNVQIHIRRDGKDVTYPITKHHPEIENPKDKHPDDIGCDEMVESVPQIYFVNDFVAILMCCHFYNIIVNKNVNITEGYFEAFPPRVSIRDIDMKPWI